jgi:hypothetical protein
MASNNSEPNPPVVSGKLQIILQLKRVKVNQKTHFEILNQVRGQEGLYLLSPIDSEYNKLAKFNDFQSVYF